MELNTDWSNLKSFVSNKNVSIQYFEWKNRYYLFAADGSMEVSTQIPIQSPANSDQQDFEENFKDKCNKASYQQVQPFASKSLPNGKNLFRREHGIQEAVVDGSNEILFTIPYNWVKITGIEVIGGELLDSASVYVLDSDSGTYSGEANKVLNQFGFDTNISKDFYRFESSYDADLHLNMQIKIVYNSISDKTIGINFTLNELK